MLRISVRERMTKAARLLIYTSMDIMDIALECGYGSRQAFTDAFGKAYSCTPARFRRKMQYYPVAIDAISRKDMIIMEQKASMTSLIAAFGRGYHTISEPFPIFTDTFARELFTDEEWNTIKSFLENGKQFFDEGDTLNEIINTHIAPTPVCRAAFCENALKTAVLSGTRQYVILGAGMDTFAYRRPAFAEKLRVFELDLPQTQTDKAARVMRAGWGTPENLTSIPVDLSRDDLPAVLSGAGFDPKVKSFFSSLGVSYYLDREAIEHMLSSISSVCAEGSTLVFDHADEGLFSAEENRVRKMVALAIGSGEPMKSCFSASELEEILARHGFLVYEQLTPEDIQSQLIGDRSCFKAFEHVNYVLAVKKR